MTEQRNGKPKTGEYRTIADGGYIGRPPTSTRARPDARNQNQASAKPAKPRMDDSAIDSAINSAMRKLEQTQAGQADDALTREARIRLAHRTLLAQVAGCRIDEVGKLRHE